MTKWSNSSRFTILVLALLLAACNPAAAPTATSEPTATSTKIEPRATSTPEPTATIVVEHPAPDQEWLLNTIFPIVREAGCEPTYETSYYPETMSIPWTLDQIGNTIQGVTALNFCGLYDDSGVPQPPYVGFARIGKGKGWLPDFVDADDTHGPTYQLAYLLEPVPLEFVGFLPTQDAEKLRDLLVCMQGDPEPWFYADVLVPTSKAVVIALTRFGYKEAKTAGPCLS